MHLDRALDYAAAGTAVLATVLDSVLRFGFFELWPFLACLLCMRYNDDYMDKCYEFLSLPQEKLDVGFGLVLQGLALGLGTIALALNWLISPQVQDILVLIFESSAGSSLPVERKHTECKRYEAARLLHLAVAARNQMHRAVLRLQKDAFRTREKAQKELGAAKHCTLGSMALKHLSSGPEDLPGVSTRYAAAPAEGAGRQPCAPEQKPSAKLRAFIHDNREELVATRTKRIEDAKIAVESLPLRDVPVTYDEWLALLRKHEKLFRGRMMTSTPDRRQLSIRLSARPDMPPPVHRIQVQRRGDKLPKEGWHNLLRHRWGWHGLRGGASTQTIFLVSWMNETHYLDMEPFRVGDFYTLADEVKVDEALRPLSTLLSTLLVNGVEKVYEFVVGARAGLNGVSFHVAHAVEVTEPLKKPKEKDEDDSDDDDDDSEDSLENLRPEDDALDSDDSGVSVDEDLDSGADSVHGEPEPPEPPEPDDSEEEDDEDEDEDGDPVAPRAPPVWRGPRAAAGTWTLYETLWFRTTHTMGEIDLKVHMKEPFRNVTEMGHRDMTKTLRPHKYDEPLDNPARTKLLLRAWELWRPRQRGWAQARDSRMRHLEAETARLEADIRALDGRAHLSEPLLECADAHALFLEWVPQLVARLLA